MKHEIEIPEGFDVKGCMFWDKEKYPQIIVELKPKKKELWKAIAEPYTQGFKDRNESNFKYDAEKAKQWFIERCEEYFKLKRKELNFDWIMNDIKKAIEAEQTIKQLLDE